MKSTLVALAMASALPGLAGTHLLFGFEGTITHFDSKTQKAVFTTFAAPASVGAAAQAPNGEIWYATTGVNSALFKVNAATGATTTVGASGQDIRALTFVGSVLYAIGNNSAGNDRLYTVNQTSGAATFVGTCGHAGIQGMGTAPNGAVYGWDVSTRHLITIDPVTAASANVSPTVFTTDPIQSLDFDRHGVMWAIASTGNYYRVNRANGAVELVQTDLGSARGLVIPKHQGRLLGLEINEPVSIDIATGRKIGIPGSGPINAALAARPDGTLWGENGNKIAQVDPGSGVRTLLAPGVSAMNAMSFRNGSMYGITNSATQLLVTINTVTGTTTTVGSTGRPQNSILAMTTSPNGTLYAYDVSLGLVTVNPASGAITDVSGVIGADSRITAIEFGPDGTLYGGNNQLYTINIASGLIMESLGGNSYAGLRALAYMPANGFYLGVNQLAAGGTFAVDIKTAVSTPLGATTPMTALTLSPEGAILALNDSSIRNVDRSTGLLSLPLVTLPSAIRSSLTITTDDQYRVGNESSPTEILELYDRTTGASTGSQAWSLNHMADICTNEDGVGFGWPTSQGLHQLHFGSASFTAVDPTPVVGVMTGATFGEDGMLYACSAGGLRRVDPTNGFETLVGSVGFNCGGLVFTPPVTTGSVILEDYVGPQIAQVVEVTLRHPGTLLDIETFYPRLNDHGGVRFASRLFGHYDITIKGKHWLRKVIPNVLITNGGLSFVSIHLVNGDSNGSNDVEIGDYSILSAAFGSALGDPTFDPLADLNGDDAVDIGDYAILSANYGAIGDD